MRILTSLEKNQGGLTARLNCPRYGGRETNMLTCTQTETIEGKDGIKSHDWECPYFIKMAIGSVDCSHPEPLPRHAERPNHPDHVAEENAAVLV